MSIKCYCDECNTEVEKYPHGITEKYKLIFNIKKQTDLFIQSTLCANCLREELKSLKVEE
jgi:hypothetical protein